MGLLSDEQFTVDGTLSEAWAGQQSFRRKDRTPSPPGERGNPAVDFRGEQRSNATHASTTDPDARLIWKAPGQAAKLAYHGHALMDNRHVLAAAAQVTLATGTAERDAALELVQGRPRRTLRTDKGYDTRDFMARLRALGITPHVAQNTTHRANAFDGRTTRHPGYALSQRKRKCVEEIFGWLKTVGASGRPVIGACPASIGYPRWLWWPPIYSACGTPRGRPPEGQSRPWRGIGTGDQKHTNRGPEAVIRWSRPCREGGKSFDHALFSILLIAFLKLLLEMGFIQHSWPPSQSLLKRGIVRRDVEEKAPGGEQLRTGADTLVRPSVVAGG